MKVYVNKEEWEWFKEMYDEGRTREIYMITYPTRSPESNLEVELEIHERC